MTVRELVTKFKGLYYYHLTIHGSAIEKILFVYESEDAKRLGRDASGHAHSADGVYVYQVPEDLLGLEVSNIFIVDETTIGIVV